MSNLLHGTRIWGTVQCECSAHFWLKYGLTACDQGLAGSSDSTQGDRHWQINFWEGTSFFNLTWREMVSSLGRSGWSEALGSSCRNLWSSAAGSQNNGDPQNDLQPMGRSPLSALEHGLPTSNGLSSALTSMQGPGCMSPTRRTLWFVVLPSSSLRLVSRMLCFQWVYTRPLSFPVLSCCHQCERLRSTSGLQNGPQSKHSSSSS